MPPVMSIYASQDVREIPREKAVAFTRALQHFAEQNNLPKRNEWCLLAESIMELRMEVKFYLSFTDEEVFRGVDLPKKEESCPMVPTTTDITTTANIPGATDVPEAQPVPKAMLEKKAPKYAGWKKSTTPILAGVSCWGDSPTIHDAKVEGKSLTTSSNDPYKPATLLIEGPVTTGISPTSKSIGIKVAAHSALRLCQSNGLPENTRSDGGRWGDAHGHYVHRAGNDSQDFKCELKPCGQR